MNRQEIMEKLNGIFCELFEDDGIQITDEMTAKDIEDWDSLAHLQLIAMVESAFSIQFSLGEINSFANVGELCDAVLRRL